MTYDWTNFYLALCRHGPRLLLIDGEEGDDVREVVAAVAADSDAFWSDGLQPLLAEVSYDGDLHAGVLAALELWRENVLTVLSADFGIDLDWDDVTIDRDSPLIGVLVEAATPDAEDPPAV